MISPFVNLLFYLYTYHYLINTLKQYDAESNKELFLVPALHVCHIHVWSTYL